MANKLPAGYKQGVTRVSDIVWFEYEFWGDWKERYFKRIEGCEREIIGGTQCLWKFNKEAPETARGIRASAILNSISPKTRRFILEHLYVGEACSVWTLIHKNLEDYLAGDKLIKDERHQKEIDHWTAYIDGLKKLRPNNSFETEVVVRDSNNRFQGTIDLIEIDEERKEVRLYDWKTWGIAKKKFDLPDTLRKANAKGVYSFKKPTDKLKKVALQLSLYAEARRQKGYTIVWIYVVVIHHSWAYEYRLFEEDHRQKEPLIRLWTSEELDELLERKRRGKEELPLDYKYVTLSNMIITVQSPTGTPYEHVVWTIDFYKEPKATSAEKMERIDQLVTSLAYTKKVVNEWPKTKQ